MPDLTAVEAKAKALGAIPQAVLRQRDIYFCVPQGRLKLRQQPGRPAELIAYARSDSAAPRPSDYRIFATEQGDELLATLTAALGVRAVVEKARTLYLWRQTRIHLDRVRDLGEFVELETVITCQSLKEGEAELRQVLAALGLATAVAEPRSYVDLILATPNA